MCKGIMIIIGFEFDEEVSETSVETVLFTTGAVVHNAVRPTLSRGSMVGDLVDLRGCVNDNHLLELSIGGCDLKKSD